jgi:hypothetical protein
MLKPRIRVLTIVCGFAVAVLLMPVSSDAGIFSCLFGPAPCAAPVYAPVVTAPACGTCVPQTCQYMPAMPTVVYRALYQPAVVTAYQPVYQPAAPCNTCTSYAVTAYRPAFPWAYQGRLVPYTTYRPVYAATPVVAYMGCNSCASYSPCDSGSSCSNGGCGTVTYGAPTSGCASCAASATILTPAPSTGVSEAAPAMGATPQKTFQDQVEKPATNTNLKPIPQPDTRLNSMPAPQLPDPKDRTATRSGYSSARVALVASPIQASPAQDNDGWQPARD